MPLAEDDFLLLKMLLGSRSLSPILGSEAPEEFVRELLFAAESEREPYVGRFCLVRLEDWREEFDADSRVLDSFRLKTPLNAENRSLSVGLLDF